MRFTVTIVVVAAMFLTSCAYQGVVVEKHSRSHPLYHSVGIEGVYTFVLRDQSGALHRQMVSPQVFEQYAEGDYFNDLQPGASRAGDYKATQTAAIAKPKSATPIAGVAKTKTPVRNATATRTAKSTKTSKVAAKSAAKRPGAKPQNKQTAWTSRTAMGKRTTSPRSTSSQAKRTTKKSVAAKRAVKKTSNADGRPLVKKEPKPWKMTEPTVETAPMPVGAQPPAEGPARSAEGSPAPQMPPAAKPTASPDDSDIVYIPPQPR